jgi:hypothetical protein
MLFLVFFSTLSSICTMHGSFENNPNALAFNDKLDTLNPLSLSTFTTNLMLQTPLMHQLFTMDVVF